MTTFTSKENKGNNFLICDECGSLVYKPDTHMAWHSKVDKIELHTPFIIR